MSLESHPAPGAPRRRGRPPKQDVGSQGVSEKLKLACEPNKETPSLKKRGRPKGWRKKLSTTIGPASHSDIAYIPETKHSGPGRPKVRIVKNLPEKLIVADQVIEWIEMHATLAEIASSFHVSPNTLNARLQEYFGVGFDDLKQLCQGKGNLTLRRYQFRLAEKNTAMAIWLGKQWLDQCDNPTAVTIAPETVSKFEQMMSQIKEAQRQKPVLIPEKKD